MKLKKLRVLNNLTQTQMAEQLKTSQCTYCNYEKEKTQPDIQTLIKIADYFNVSIDYLLDHKSSNIFDTSGCTQTQIEVMKQIQELDDFQTERVKAFIKGMQSGSKQSLNKLQHQGEKW